MRKPQEASAQVGRGQLARVRTGEVSSYSGHSSAFKVFVGSASPFLILSRNFFFKGNLTQVPLTTSFLPASQHSFPPIPTCLLGRQRGRNTEIENSLSD